MKSDLDIAQETKLEPIQSIVDQLDINVDEWEPYGKHKAKVSPKLLNRLTDKKDAKLILVTSINPTRAGEGKSTVTVGLGQALKKRGKHVSVALREPSLGPVMGIKGGATGGGYAQVVPMEDINLHFTGDLHAITSANNTLSAIIDNHLFQGNELELDVRRITWKRVVDINDRALREVIVGLGGIKQGVPREDQFDITVASEIMAILCLADSYQDLKDRLSRIVIGYKEDETPITVRDLKAAGVLALLLKDAFSPNLVQTIEGVPAFIHGGPFANIAHGCNSLLATKMASKLTDYVVTEAGFGADLGAEKFLNIKSRIGNLNPDAVVVVATTRALKLHGGIDESDLTKENLNALSEGLENLAKHLETIEAFGLPAVVAINQFETDTKKELELIKEWCRDRGVSVAGATVWADGGEGGLELADKVIETAEQENTYQPLYPLDIALEDKIELIATTVYGAKSVDYTNQAKEQLKLFKRYGWTELPICMAKTQYSLSDQPDLIGRPEDFTITIRAFKPSIGAGFIVALTGDILTMPGLPKEPAALNMDLSPTGKISGLF